MAMQQDPAFVFLGTGPVVLVVDDDEDTRCVFVDVLEEAGYTAIAAANGREALRVLRGGVVPIAILLDLMMPVMDGWDFRAAQLRDPLLKDIPVVLVTSAGFSAKTFQDQLHGVELVRKPSKSDELLAAVARAIVSLH
ncbi:MAG TPA: response regulator [Bryobacteraceae bacterium]|nr:response regulator [Bryobacteraceae bacterium]